MTVTNVGSIGIAPLTSEDWASIEVQFDDGVTQDTWTTSTTDAYSAIADLISWLASIYGVTATCEVGITSSVMTLGGTFDYVANAAAQSVLGMSTFENGVETFAFEPATLLVTAWGEVPALVRAWNTDRVAASQGAPSPQANAHQAQRATVPVIMNATQAARWRYCLEVAVNPRQAYVWVEALAGWYLVTIGAAKPEPAGAIRYRMNVEVLS